jgi:hypothetical protein
MPKTSPRMWPTHAPRAKLPGLALLTLALLLSACIQTPTATEGGAIETTLCRVWGESLPTRSRADTAQTQGEIGASYADFAAACPNHRNLIP